MGILTKEVSVRPRGTMIQYYMDKGYDAKYNQPLMVRVKDLPKYSKEKVEVLCDICQENTILVSYSDYNKVIENTGSYVCRNCSREKIRNTNLKKYGVEVPAQSKQVVDKMRKTTLERYGVEIYSKTKECIEKMEKTMEQRYGVKYALQSKYFQNAYKNTCIEKYGKDYCDIFVKMSFDSYYKNTGYANPFQSEEVRKKATETYYNNGTVETSKQQLYIFYLYNKEDNSELNYPISYYNVDICFPKEKLTIEYDGGFHNGQVKTGRLTQEEFNKKEIIRNNIIKREGYKQMRIISSKDLLPSDDMLLQMLQDARTYFSQYPNHSWQTYDIDKSLLFNAEHKDGIPYFYGSLRTIKESDLQFNNTIK